jgi:XRE family transcriptional regulator, regulator of sulfur utilization
MTATNRNPILAAAFGAVIRAMRLEKGIAQESLALVAEVDRSYLGRVERGEKQPSLDMVFRLAHALDCKPSELVEAVASSLGKKKAAKR